MSMMDEIKDNRVSKDTSTRKDEKPNKLLLAIEQEAKAACQSYYLEKLKECFAERIEKIESEHASQTASLSAAHAQQTAAMKAAHAQELVAAKAVDGQHPAVAKANRERVAAELNQLHNNKVVALKAAHRKDVTKSESELKRVNSMLAAYRDANDKLESDMRTISSQSQTKIQEVEAANASLLQQEARLTGAEKTLKGQLLSAKTALKEQKIEHIKNLKASRKERCDDQTKQGTVAPDNWIQFIGKNKKGGAGKMFWARQNTSFRQAMQETLAKHTGKHLNCHSFELRGNSIANAATSSLRELGISEGDKIVYALGAPV